MINVPDGGIQHQFDGYTLLALGWGGLGLVLRLIVLWSSLGTNDTYYWYEFGLLVDRVGLIRAYDLHPSLNHPFLPTLWASVCYSLSPVDIPRFAFWMRLPAIAGDILSGLLLWRVYTDRGEAQNRCWALGAWALSPAVILFSAFHCNTDSLCVALAFWAVFIAERKKWFWAGLVLASAIHIKLIATILIPAFVVCCPRKKLWKLASALFLGAIPFLGLFTVGDGQIFKKIVGYSPAYENWGFLGLSQFVGKLDLLGSWVFQAAWQYHDLYGKWVFMIVLWVGVLWKVPKKSVLHLGAYSVACFLVFAPGFGIQYLAYLTLPVLMVSIRWGIWLTGLTSVFVVSVYYVFWDTVYPARSFFISPYPFPVMLVGLIGWISILVFGVWCWVQSYTFEKTRSTPLEKNQ